MLVNTRFKVFFKTFIKIGYLIPYNYQNIYLYTYVLINFPEPLTLNKGFLLSKLNHHTFFTIKSH